MKEVKKIVTLTLLMAGFAASAVLAQPETPVSEWSGKTILLVGAHPDDDSRSYGTLSMLRENGKRLLMKWIPLRMYRG